MAMTAEDYQELIGVGKLYEDQPDFSDKDMFKNPLWHPGVVDETKHFCWIHGLNLYSDGPIFDTAEKFCELYVKRTHGAKNFALTDIELKGVSFANL